MKLVIIFINMSLICAQLIRRKYDGLELKKRINCLYPVSTDTHSNLQGCKEKNVIYCKLISNDSFCKFNGSNIIDTLEIPKCWYNCGTDKCLNLNKCSKRFLGDGDSGSDGDDGPITLDPHP